MKIGIYSGSFAPVHKGHIKIVREIIKSKLVDKVLIVPTKEYWDKKIKYSLKDRINMLKLYETKHIEVETKLNNTNGTYELFSKYQKKHPTNQLYLILGADNLEKFEEWINYIKLLEYPFIIVKRDKQGNQYIKQRMKELNKKNYTILNIPNIDISSSYIRDNFDKPDLLRNKLDPRIYKYIKNKTIS